ncbi:uncharacterized protein LOC108094737 [Drosophila ficusphila]|uniref:uncharacterized protein LOC108094737 n=1 Tax=Drosophila ficusphila TaxID=30025 RepID=UPI0007E65FF8|nr:uncharacterized protein LOC108094737 [Drosophila ficusphila]
MDGWMAAFLDASFLATPPALDPPVGPANCVNGKATAAFANFAAAATKAGGQQQQQHRVLHKCIYIYIYLSDGRALYCSYVLDGPAKWRSEKNP